MALEELLQQYPLKRIKPFNGMAITANIWEEAHDYHRRRQELLTTFGHGPGILTGLEVIASDPPDTSLYILPGVAIDTSGQIIVLAQAVAYDIGQELEGPFSLVLSYSESRRRFSSDDQPKSAPVYIHGEYSISAQVAFDNSMGVELARVRRSSRTSVMADAQNPALPGTDEIDLRYRRLVGASPQARVAVSYLGEATDARYGQGVAYLAQTLNDTQKYHIVVEDGMTLGPGIETNTLLYLVGQGEFELSAGAMNGLYNYVQRGRGTIFMESVDKAAKYSFIKFLTAKDLVPLNIRPRHRLLTRPYFFPDVPAGAEVEAKPELMEREGVIFSTGNYSLLWQGERWGRAASREEVRAAVEWGANIITYAMLRRR